MRPGIRTTEFWLALLVTVLGAVATVKATNELAQIGGMVAAALSSAGYSFSRGAAKSESEPDQDS